MKRQHKQYLLTLQLIILGILAAVGIMYILDTSPISEVDNYQKQSSSRPFVRSSDSSYFPRREEADSDAISLTGKSGSYEEARIGKSSEDE